MAKAATAETTTADYRKDSFASLLEESIGAGNGLEGSVLKGTVVAVENDFALIDVGLKSEGRVQLKEFSAPGQKPEIKVGDTVEVFLERMEDKNGEAVLSREKARREEAWTQLEKTFKDNQRVTGVIFGRVKGGFTVDLSGAVAFLPGSQVDIRPVRDVGPLMGTPQPFQILKMDRARGNIVVSRRAFSRESTASPFLSSMRSRKTSTVSPTLISGFWPGAENSLSWTRPSDLRPTSMRAKSFSMATTVPLSTLPSRPLPAPIDSSSSEAKLSLR